MKRRVLAHPARVVRGPRRSPRDPASVGVAGVRRAAYRLATLTTLTTLTALTALMALTVFLGACGHTSTPSPARVSVAPPVDWRPWNAETFERAAREGKHLLVSVQAHWCHWCHVMNERTFGDVDIRRRLDEGFVAIAVDADARPDLAERFRDFAWPATALFTPDGTLVVALRGFRAPRAFAEILDDVRAGRVARVASASEGPPLALEALRQQASAQLDGFYDAAAGGWGRPQKYPLGAPVEHLLFRASARCRDEAAGEATEPQRECEARGLARVTQTLEGYARLLDPVDGGVYQYSLRGDWGHPHFERIALVQADVLASFAHAARVYDARWLEPAARVEAFLAGTFRSEDGTFASSQDADLDARVTGDHYFSWDATGRAEAGVPRVDRAPYADRNGRLIEALVALHVARIAADAPVGGALQLALDAASRFERTHRDEDGGFRHGAVDDGLRHLADQVWMLRAELALYEATGDARWKEHALTTARFLLDHLALPEGGFAAHTEDPAAVGELARRRRPLVENAVAARALLRLHRLDGEAHWREAAEGALAHDEHALRQAGRTIGELALALDELAAPYVLVSVVGPAGDARADALHRAALALPPPRLVELGRPGASRYPYPDVPAAYLCDAVSCSVPVGDGGELRAAAARFLNSR
ncbi:MAG: thioredoxin domain-containing protein [Myxococcales bacterium]|nr:thioredoxin domain-containing protein [Myxococcales bacterium]